MQLTPKLTSTGQFSNRVNSTSVLVFVLFFVLFDILSPGAASDDKSLSVKVGAYENSPKIYIDTHGHASGFWPELTAHIAEMENWKIEYVSGSWAEGLERLKKNEIDIMPDVAYTKERNDIFLFSKSPVLMSWSRVYIGKSDTGIESFIDLRNKTIAVLKGSVNAEGPGGFKDMARSFDIDYKLLELESYIDVFKAVMEGRADAGITNRNFGYANEIEFKLTSTPIVFQPVAIKFAFPKSLKFPRFSGHLEKPEIYGQQEVFRCQRKRERATAGNSR